MYQKNIVIGHGPKAAKMCKPGIVIVLTHQHAITAQLAANSMLRSTSRQLSKPEIKAIARQVIAMQLRVTRVDVSCDNIAILAGVRQLPFYTTVLFNDWLDLPGR